MFGRSCKRPAALAAALFLLASCASEPLVLLGPAPPQDPLAAQSALLRDELGREPPIPGNKVTILRDGLETLPAMFGAMAAARDSINLEYFIFEDVHWGGISLGDLLEHKLAEGVAVHVLMDAFGSFGSDPGFLARLKRDGAVLTSYAPLDPLVAKTLHNPNDRNHRKIMVIDGRSAFVGGVNLDRVYENPRIAGDGNDDPKAAYWRDTDARIDGPAVAALQRVFMRDWAEAKGPALPPRDWFPQVSAEGEETVRIIPSAPGDDRPLFYVDRLSAIHAARQSITFSTGYFVPSHQEREELAKAARRGVRVRLILPAESDSPEALAAGRASYGDLLEAGVEIYELTNAVLHSKTGVIDGVWTAIGSSNLDHRSAVFNKEVDAVVLGRATAREMEALFEFDIGHARRIDLRSWENRPFGEKLSEFWSRLFAWWL